MPKIKIAVLTIAKFKFILNPRKYEAPLVWKKISRAGKKKLNYLCTMN